MEAPRETLGERVKTLLEETVEKASLGADFSRVTIRFCAKSAFRRNADDDGSATACGIALLLLPPGRPDFGRSPLALDRSLRGLQFRAGVAEESLQLHGAALD